jgi:hypothetical protein
MLLVCGATASSVADGVLHLAGAPLRFVVSVVFLQPLPVTMATTVPEIF